MASTPEPVDCFAVLLAGDDHELLDEVYDRVEWLGGRELSGEFRQMNQSIRVARDVLLADFAIREGGFSDLFRSEVADLRALPESYDSIGATVAAGVMRDVIAAVAPQAIDGQVESGFAHWKKHQGTGPNDGLYEFNMAYLRQDPDPETLIAQFIRNHALEISELFSAK